MPVADDSELIRFALPKVLADEIRALQRDLGDRDPKPGKFFRDRAAGLIQRERQRQADRAGLADMAKTAADVRELRDRFDQFLGIFQAFAKLQTETTAGSLKAIETQLESLNRQLDAAAFSAALDSPGQGADQKAKGKA